MAQEGRTLDNGVLFPEITFDALGGKKIVLPAGLKDRWTVLLFYRGKW